MEAASWPSRRLRSGRATQPSTSFVPVGKTKAGKKKDIYGIWKGKVFYDCGARRYDRVVLLSIKQLVPKVSRAAQGKNADEAASQLPQEVTMKLPLVTPVWAHANGTGFIAGCNRDGLTLTLPAKSKGHALKSQTLPWASLLPVEVPVIRDDFTARAKWVVNIVGLKADERQQQLLQRQLQEMAQMEEEVRLPATEDEEEVEQEGASEEDEEPEQDGAMTEVEREAWAKHKDMDADEQLLLPRARHWLRTTKYKVALELRPGDPVQMKLGTSRGNERSLQIQCVSLCPNVCVCIEHLRREATLDCFCSAAVEKALSMGMVSEPQTVVRWGSAVDYAVFWNTVVEMEAVTAAVEDNTGRLISGVDISWLDRKTGRFYLPSKAMKANHIHFRQLVRGRKDDCGEWSSGWLCIRQCKNMHSEGFWTGHGAVVECSVQALKTISKEMADRTGKDVLDFLGDASNQLNTFIVVTFKLMGSSTAPHLEVSRDCVVEYFAKPANSTHLARSLVDLSRASPLTQEVVLKASAPLEVSPYMSSLAEWELNWSQEQAVRLALEEPLALVHGPPGTGKTRMAAALAVMFVMQNAQEGSPERQRVVLYCGPSNDVVDHSCISVGSLLEECSEKHMGVKGSQVSECVHYQFPELFEPTRRQQRRLKKISKTNCPHCTTRQKERTREGVNLLRIYSKDMERKDFPIPNQNVLRNSGKRVKEVPKEMRKYALHWRCHGVAPGVKVGPEAENCRRLYHRLLEDVDQAGERDFRELMQEYLKAFERAREEELGKADILFVTCSSSRSLVKWFVGPSDEESPQCVQVIIDEAAQVTEPETLCPLVVSKDIKRIALIGDPKQLRPIIRSNSARVLGLDVPLLERLSATPQANPSVLRLQYRMHPVLNSFTSEFFYQGSVSTDVSVAIREPGLLAHPMRPNESAPILFWEAAGPDCKEGNILLPTANFNTRSQFNTGEAQRAAELAKDIVEKAQEQDMKVSVAVLTWYNAQVMQLVKLLRDVPSVTVGNVVNSQGAEYDYVILSTVRRTYRGPLGVVGNTHFFNVAVTRARHGLCIIGEAATLRIAEAWGAIIDLCNHEDTVSQVKPNLVVDFDAYLRRCIRSGTPSEVPDLTSCTSGGEATWTQDVWDDSMPSSLEGESIDDLERHSMAGRTRGSTRSGTPSQAD